MKTLRAPGLLKTPVSKIRDRFLFLLLWENSDFIYLYINLYTNQPNWYYATEKYKTGTGNP